MWRSRFKVVVVILVGCCTWEICTRNCSICRHRSLGWTFFIFLPFLCQRVRWILKTLMQIWSATLSSVPTYLSNNWPTNCRILNRIDISLDKTSKEKNELFGSVTWSTYYNILQKKWRNLKCNTAKFHSIVTTFQVG